MANAEIREMLKKEKIPYWKIGAVLGVHENTIVRKMRFELSDSDRESFLCAVKEIQKSEEN